MRGYLHPIQEKSKKCSTCSKLSSKKRIDPFPMVKCGICETEFQSKTLRARYCSVKCQHRAAYEKNPYNVDTFGTGMRANKGACQDPEHVKKRIQSAADNLAKTRRNCVKCNEEYTPTLSAQKYCSGRCWQSAKRKNRDSLHRVKITETHYEVLFSLQGGKCKICATPSGSNGRGDKLAVDHCHESGKIRGLLCHRCNTALGLLKDSQLRMQAAIDYLKESESRIN